EARRMLAANITVNSTADTNTRDGVLTFREALLVNNGTLAKSSLSAQEQAQITGSPDTGTNTIAFNFPTSDPNHFYYKNGSFAGHRTPANVPPTTTDDASLPTTGSTAVDPDWAHSWFSIRPTSALPSITHAVTIDGYTQSGASANTNPVSTGGLNT